MTCNQQTHVGGVVDRGAQQDLHQHITRRVVMAELLKMSSVLEKSCSVTEPASGDVVLTRLDQVTNQFITGTPAQDR